MQNKIAVEEHYDLPPITAAGKNAFRQSYLDDVQDRLHNRDARLREMDAFGIGYSVMSLTEPGIQGLVNASEAIELAKRANDHVYEYYISAYPTRFGGLAALPVQDPRAAAKELERAVKQLGFRGAMINGFTDTADENHPLYLDNEGYWRSPRRLRCQFSCIRACRHPVSGWR